MVELTFVNTFWLTRIILLRFLGFIYSTAFLVSLFQNRYLIGYNGLSPVDIFLDRYATHYKQNNSIYLFFMNPTILWFIQNNGKPIDMYLDILSWFGLIMAGFVMLLGKANKIILFLLWITYMSIVNVGQEWYSFGWESQLLESGFLAIFMCHLYSLDMFSNSNKPSFIPIMLFRWLIFRIMIGAGMIKIRGDKCWRDLTCMNYHYLTQPVPNPVAYYLHKEPEIIHKIETAGNHIVELLLPWLLLLPQPLVKYGGHLQILFQVILIISGNLSFLNWLTILPSLCCYNDGFYSKLFNKEKLKYLKEKIDDNNNNSNKNTQNYYWKLMRKLINTNTFILLLVTVKSVPVIINILSPTQVMNTSFDSFRLVNTYGAFGSITKTRMEVIIEGSYSSNPLSKESVWKEYEFKCKPGNIYKRPCLISPYHYRLDWLMWFAAFQNPRQNPWFYHLLYKFLLNDGSVDDLIAYNPFKNSKRRPKWIRASHYKYFYTDSKKYQGTNSSQWWHRTYIQEYVEPLNLESLRSIANDFKWNR